MLAILLVCLIGACAAAPHFPQGPPPFHPDSHHGPGHHHHHHHHHYDPFSDEIFDTRQFWEEMANEMRQLDALLAEFYKKFPSINSSQGVEGNQYKISIPLSGFEEKEIVVKAREGVLMVQAVHKMEEGGERSYLDIKTLPSWVNVSGSWTFEDSVLKIVFPLKPDAPTVESITETEAESPVTEAHSREEMASGEDQGNDVDADVGARGDQENQGNQENQENQGSQGKERELFNNEIPRNTVEATTYAVDLNGDVEFVPVRYR